MTDFSEQHPGRGMSALGGRVALVTGSSRGIGQAIAAELARQGAAVAVHGRDQAAAGEVVTGIRQQGGTAVPVTGDVTSFGQLEDLRRQVEDELGPVDILVANAGGSFTPPAPLEDIPEAGWRATIDGNLLATFLTLKAFLPGMKQRGRGAIITIASSAGRRADARAPIPYGAAKAAIALMTQDVAAQAGPSGVRVNCIAPETILTERNRQQIPPAQQAAMAGFHPLKRLGTPQDVAAAAAFLASDSAAWITGVILDITGGAVMT
jgi:3-oxoacyl-[acyl-carrier protein] reductase